MMGRGMFGSNGAQTGQMPMTLWRPMGVTADRL